MIISIALSALCSTLEATLLSTPLSYITGLEEQGAKGASRLKALKQNPDRPISAILCVNTIANTVGASIVGSLVYEVYGDALEIPQNEDYWGNVNPIGVRACYDEGKRAAEALIYDYIRKYNIDVRFTNTYTINQNTDMTVLTLLSKRYSINCGMV